MHFLDVLTIIVTGLLIGNELAVSLFVNPVIWQLDESAQAKALSLFAHRLGRAMPFWYAASLILMIMEAWFRRNQPNLTLILVAVGIWFAIILVTVTFLVPINNRVAGLKPGSLPESWLQEHKKWDNLHRWRILSLVVAMICLVSGMLSAS
jgi:uncharacterized membrane protein